MASQSSNRWTKEARMLVDVQDAALQEPPFPTQHGLDSGTINPTTFKNGIVLDVAQAAMASVPSDLDLHRGRTIVMTAHSNDVSVALGEEWTMQDEGYARERILQVPASTGTNRTSSTRWRSTSRRASTR